MRWIAALSRLSCPACPALAGQPEHAPRIELVTTGSESSAREPKVTSPFGVGFDSAGTLYFVEMVGNRVRKLGRAEPMTTLAGTGRKG